MAKFFWYTEPLPREAKLNSSHVYDSKTKNKNPGMHRMFGNQNYSAENREKKLFRCSGE